jgi:hypothetical protein
MKRVTLKDVFEVMDKVNRLLKNTKLLLVRGRGIGIGIYVVNNDGSGALVWEGLTKREAWYVLDAIRIVLEQESRGR